MNKKLLVINAVGLTENLINEHSIWLKKYMSSKNLASLTAPLPAVTCTSQATMLTGTHPSKHGIVANGWYFKDLAQILLWRQNNQLVTGEKIWEKIKRRHNNFTTAKMFWWYNMYSSADFSITPRPLYRSDGLKIPESYSYPPELKSNISKKHGSFPLFKFWGPMTTIESTDWIGKSTQYIIEKEQPNLVLTYLPHLDYNLQRLGHTSEKIKQDVLELENVIKDITLKAEQFDYEIIILSEYGIQNVDQPIHINQALRQHGYITPTIQLGEEHPDIAASKAFAMSDHQIAHIYIQNKNDIPAVRKIIESLPGVASVFDRDQQKDINLDHERSGELIALSKPNAWFTYYYWLDENKAPDFARTVDIHKKPGYDPVELFLCKGGKLKAAKSLIKKKLGFRYLMDVIPLNAKLVKGSHGVPTESVKDGPLLLSSKEFCNEQTLNMRNIFNLIDNWFN